MRVSSTLDYKHAGDFAQLWGGQLRQGARVFLLDFSQTQFLDSQGLGSVFRLCRRVLTLEGGTVAIVAPSAPVRTTISLARLDRSFPIFESLADARAALTVDIQRQPRAHIPSLPTTP